MVLIVLFAISGAAALIYEIVWFQLLQLVVGSSAVSLGVILATFMGGLCLGSFLMPRVVGPENHPLRIFALLEVGTAILGIIVLVGMPYLGAVYAAIGGYGGWSVLARALVSGLCLLPPTILMGATLPAVARWVDATPRGASWVGLFYAANIAGGVLGSLFAGFYLLRVYDMAVATYVAAGMNLIVAGVAAGGAVREARARQREAVSDDRPRSRIETSRAVTDRPYRNSVYLAIALSGFTALGAEVVWTRMLSLLLGASVYTFSIILAVFLFGLGLGSTAGAVLARRVTDARRALGICQLLAGAAIAWAAYMLTQELPYWPIDSTLARHPWFNFQLDLFRASWAMLPAASLWGASFPLALAAIAGRGHDAGRSAGDVYAANTIGAIAGALVFGLTFVQFFGSQRAQQALVAASVLAGALTLVSTLRLTAVVSSIVVLVFLARTITPIPGDVIGYGRFTARTLSYRDPITREYFKPNFLYVGEGLNASVAVSQTSAGHRNFHVSGKIEASTEPRDMRLQRMLGHLSALAHPQPRSVLVVGFGAGVTAGTFLTHPGIERIVICEIEPLIPRVVAKYFGPQNYNVAEDTRVEIVYDDARHFLLTTKERFDVITSDPIHPWVKGAATLYSAEYIALAKRHLNPGGVISQWVPLYQSSAGAVKSALATFFEAFPGGTVWSNDVGGRGYDVVLLGQDSDRPIDGGELDRRLNLPDYARVRESLHEVGFANAADLASRLMASSHDLKPWLADAEINRDRNLRLQYLAGMGMNLDEGDAIHAAMLQHRAASHGPSGRMLNTTQAAAILNKLKGRPRRISISAVAGDEEAYQYATQLRQVLVAAGWQVEGVNRSVFSEAIPPLLISVGSDPPPPTANELFSAFRDAGLTIEGSLNPQTGPDSVLLFIGENP